MKEPKINYELNSLKGVLLQSSRFGISSYSYEVLSYFNNKNILNTIEAMELDK